MPRAARASSWPSCPRTSARAASTAAGSRLSDGVKKTCRATRWRASPSYVDAVFEHTLGLLATVTTAAEVLGVWNNAA